MTESKLLSNQDTDSNSTEAAPQLNIVFTTSSPGLQAPTPTTKRKRERRYGRFFDKQVDVPQAEESESGSPYESDSEGRALSQDLDKPLPPALRVSRFKEHLDEPSFELLADSSEVNSEKAIASSKVNNPS